MAQYIYGGSALLAMSVAMPAYAQVKSIDIPARSAQTAITMLGQQADIQIVAARRFTQAKNTNAVRGNYTPEEALRRLFHGTGLTALQTGPQTYTVIQQIAMLAAPAPERARAPSLPLPPAAPNVRDAQGSGGLEEIVVTAEKREANLQNVPISITAVTGKSLETSGAVTLRDLPKIAPGVTFTAFAASAYPFIRGVGQFSALIGVESPVAIYLDGVYLTSAVGSALNLNNIERVEVLKGPQGTLFGRNATGGVIQIVTENPANSLSGRGELSYGKYGVLEGRGAISGPIATGLTATFSVYGRDQKKGYGRNVVTGNDLFVQEGLNLFGKVRWLSEDGDTDLRGAFLYDHVKNNTGAASVDKGFLAEDGVTRYISEYVISNRIDPSSNIRSYLGYARAQHDSDQLRVVNLFAYHRMNDHERLTQNGIPGGIRNPFTNATPSALILLIDQSSRTVTNEFQLQSSPSSPTQWVMGLYYLNNKSKGIFPFLPNGVSPPTRVVNGQITTTSYAAFAQATIPLSSATRATAGIRYTIDKLELEGTDNGVGLPATPAAAGIDPRVTQKRPTWRLAIDHDLSEDILVYGSYNRGFKSGRFAPNNFSNPAAAPEKIDSYEAGFKSELLDRRLRINAAFFLYNYSNIQLRAVTPGGVIRVFNAASAKGRGLDFEAQAVPVRRLTLSAGFTWLPKAEYSSFPSGPITRALPTGGVNQTGIGNLSGNRMVRAPKLSANIGINYRYVLASGSAVTFSANDNYNSGFAWEPDGRRRQQAYHDLSGSVGWEAPASRFTVRGWVKNLFDEKIRATDITASTDLYVPGEPVTYGIAVGFRF
jgi:iron complex outermembrane receptor protein